MKNRIIVLFAIVLFCMCLIPQRASAQRYRALEQNMSVESVIMNEIGLGVNYSIGCNIDNVFFAGAGLGVGGWVASNQEMYTNFYCTMFAQLRGNFLPTKSVRPYIDMIAGYDLATLSMYLKPSVGILIPASSSCDMFVGVGYTMQGIEYDLDEVVVKDGIGITFGVRF